MIPRYTLPEMGAIWEERAKFRHWLLIEVLAAEAWSKLGVVPEAEMTEIHERATEVDPARVEELEETLQHDVVAFLTALGESVGPASRWIHYGMTSSDLLDTALALQLRESSDLLLAKTEALLAALKRRALEFQDTVTVGRTHGIHAEPTTFGLKLAVWAFEVARDKERLARARDAVAVGKIAGPVGTYASVDPFVEEYVCTQLGLKPEEAATQVIQRDRHAEYLTACAITSSTLEKIATEIRHLQRTEVREVEEPFREGQKGSSAMPHKRNPITTERVTGLARVLRGYAQAALEDVALWHERDISHSGAERVILPDATILLDYMQHLVLRVVAGMTVHGDRMLANLELTCGALFSQRVLLALISGGMTRDDAYRIVQRLAQQAWDTQTPLRELLAAEDLPLDLDAIFDYGRFTRHVPELIARLDTILVPA
jgi:adenylosuccinate lyase